VNVRKIGFVSTLVAIAVSMPFFGASWNLFMHIFGAILFMGNIIVTAGWTSMAKRSGNADAVRFAARSIVATDAIFTGPGAIMVLLNGGIIGTPWFKTGDSWLILSLVLFLVSAVIWLAVLMPIQRKLVVASNDYDAGPLPEEATELLKKWFRFGGIATLLPLAILVLMVVKPSLW
jgi:uncharacterized membrane protein